MKLYQKVNEIIMPLHGEGGGNSVYELCEFYSFRHPILRAGFQPCQGGLITNAVNKYPEAWSYLQTEEGQLLCKTETEWQNMTKETWGDGEFKASWDGIGGVPYFVQDIENGTLRLPDLRGMFACMASDGIIGPKLGEVAGDRGRNINGRLYTWFAPGYYTYSGFFGPNTDGQQYTWSQQVSSGTQRIASTLVNSSNVVPSGATFLPRSYGTLTCVYLGKLKNNDLSS